MNFQPMSQEEAKQVVSWQYQGEYSFYDMKADLEDYEKFIHPNTRNPHTYSAYEDGEFIGIFTAQIVGERTIDIGLGMRPDLTGRGMGQRFIEKGLKYVGEQIPFSEVTLAVASFNKRAIKVYERIGFETVHTFYQKTNGGEFLFVKMVKK
ncbi:GNAT family N-acetyltransferase [Halobacillus seohaensis]|uniref:GNAT family N-acetyltransferase n=1 Tax=Halobacillus seohaensis TaxID=447421 RepID=A0ABW2EK04_9BACI